MSDNYHHGNLRQALIDAGVKIINEEGEDKLSRLIARLLEMGRNDEILSATKNATLRNQLYEKYSIV